MAQKELTPRQQEIKALMQDGKRVPEIAKKLKISENAVYQQLRRMRDTKPGAAPKASAAAKPKAARKAPAAPAPEPVVETVVRESTPLQAVRARRAAIKAALQETGTAHAEAERAAKAAKEAHEKAAAKHADELKQLDAAEGALVGKKVVDGQVAKPKPASAPKAPTGGNARTKPATPASGAGSAPSGNASSTSTTASGSNGKGEADPAELARQGDAAAAAEAEAAQAAAEAPQG